MYETCQDIALGNLAEIAAFGVAYQLIQSRPLLINSFLVVGILDERAKTFFVVLVGLELLVDSTFVLANLGKLFLYVFDAFGECIECVLLC